MIKILGSNFDSWELTIAQNDIFIILDDIEKNRKTDILMLQRSEIPKWEAIEIAYGVIKSSEVLSAICEKQHSSCNDSCPVYLLKSKTEKEKMNCEQYRNGDKMFQFILDNLDKREYQ